MGADLNSNIDVTVNLSAPAVTTAGFGIPLWAGSVEAGFTERIRKYESNDDAAADDDLSTAAKAGVAAAFSQSPAPSQVAVGKVEADQAKVMTYTFSGTPEVGDKLKITCNDIETEHTADSTTLNDEVGDLRSDLVTALAGEDVTVGGADAVITITADNAGEDFTSSALITLTDDGDLAVAEVETTANRNLTTELDLILQADKTWYGFTIASRAKAELLEAAAWGAANKRLFSGQTSDADVKTSATDDVMSTAKSLSRRHAFITYNATDTEYSDMSWLAKTLCADPDNVTTFWANKILTGVTKSNLTPAERDYILGKNGNVYMDFYGNGATWQGRACDGTPLDVVVTADWLQARLAEAEAQHMSDISNLNLKDPYTDPGITTHEAILMEVLKLGERVGHFTPGSTSVTAPKASAVTTAKKNARELDLTFIAETAGAIEKVTIVGSVVTDL